MAAKRPLWSVGAVGAVVLVGMLACSPAPAAAACAPGCIAAENAKPGTPSLVWDIPGAGSSSIQGFATDISVNVGATVSFKIDTTASSYRIDVYRLGWYGGDGARKVDTVSPSSVQSQQPPCRTESATGLVDCGNWATSASWTVPADAVSGVYFAHLVRTDGTAGESHIPFVVRDDSSHSDLLLQTSDTTWEAYNEYGGHSLYAGGPGVDPDRAYKVSYNRPFATRGQAGGEDYLFNAEYPMIRWLERNGYDVSYTTGVDSDRRGDLIRNHRVFMSVGHDEYWSGGQRANLEGARDAGVNLAFFSGNEIFWKTRWEDDHRTLVSYKETHNSAKIDPTSTWTGSWRDPRPFNPEGARPENALSGTLFMVNAGDAALQVPPSDGLLRLWRGSGVAALAAAGQTSTLTQQTVGYEWDEDVDNGARPAGLVPFSTTFVPDAEVLQDYGHTYAPNQPATHRVTLYRDTNGAGPDALVFGAGTVQWSWGLDGEHDRGGSTPDASMQQATVNLMADMGVQPLTLQAGLSGASASTDTLAPSTSIAAPAPGTSVTAGTPVTASGTAADEGGGRVGAVEVSVDGGASWHPASGRESWSYTWTPSASGPATVLARAADDSANLGPRPPGTTGTAAGGSAASSSSSSSSDRRRRGPTVRLSPHRVRVSRKGIVALRVACPRSAGRCHVALRLTLRRRTVARQTHTVRGGKPKAFRLKLTRKARRELARKRSLRVTATAVVRDAAGRTATTRTTIRLLAARRH